MENCRYRYVMCESSVEGMEYGALQSSSVGEGEQEESFESAGKNVDLFLCQAKAWGTPRMYLMSITQDMALRWGLGVGGQWLL